MIRVFRKFHNIHFVGVGGTGMSGIAEVLVNMGFQVTGSDLLDTDVTDHLKSLGCQIYHGHNPEHVGQSQVVVYSSAVSPENLELRAARDRHIPIIPRAEMLGELMRLKFGIAVAGTHGKTTTTSMAAEILSAGGLDPTIIVGGRLRSMKSGAKMGLGPVLIAEADEFDRSFLKLFPDVAVITTLETEHLDCYRDLEDIKDTFVEFANKVPFFGSVILCMDETDVRDLEPRIKRPVVHYGINPTDGITARDLQFDHENSSFTVYYAEKKLGQVHLHVPGIHNVKNALAAIAVGLEMDIDFPVVQKALNRFSGVHRRFDIKGEAQGILIVDDYGHHPTEIRATLEAAKQGWNRRIIAVFQPHLYSRTRDFYREFGEVFLKADVLRVMEIYAARERPIAGVSGDMVSQAAREAGHPDTAFCPTPEDVLKELEKICHQGDMIITFGAGDVGKIANELFKRLGGNNESPAEIPDWRVPL